jgi:hypothetical protein
VLVVVDHRETTEDWDNTKRVPSGEKVPVVIEDFKWEKLDRKAQKTDRARNKKYSYRQLSAFPNIDIKHKETGVGRQSLSRLFV